ncbi:MULTISPECIES: DUF2815 family protein [Eisenbergiella]|uniref:DUF2815 family protein n=1 Tax=Eisenbergiella TaxID=1432051 RepID=UPI0023F2829F|nr:MULTISPECIES: DUF2815 family protein [Eisenbergiella]MCI6709994.1 DUF2815 family protein [Eisenbergiella massiliensis]MDY5529078.1 DUF2815 family protein [Eisenbergiella porci]
MNELTNVTTGEVRLSYVHLFKPYAFQPGQEEKFSCTLLIPKTDTDTMARINNAIAAATEKGVSDRWNGVRPPVIPNPVYDGDGVRPSDGMEFGPECKGHWVITASAKADYPPEVVDENMNPIINQSAIYSGIYGRVNLSFFPYAFGGKKGIGCGLGPVQKLRDGESLGGSAPTAAQVFGAAAPATPAYGVAPAPASGVYGGIAQQPYAAPYGGQAQPAGYTPQYSQPAQPAINPITGLPF